MKETGEISEPGTSGKTSESSRVWVLMKIFIEFFSRISLNWKMHLFRVYWIRSFVLMSTIILFCNLTFLQVEVVLTGLNENGELISNFSFLLDLNAMEEQHEKGETSDKDPAKEVDIMLHDTHLHHALLFLLLDPLCHLSNDDLYNHGYLKEFCPPPEA